MKTIGLIVELKISVSDKVAEKIKAEIAAGGDFSIHPAFGDSIKLEHVNKDGVVTGEETATVKDIGIVDYSLRKA